MVLIQFLDAAADVKTCPLIHDEHGAQRKSADWAMSSALASDEIR
ncbi:hypothetical protein TUM20985_41180 [Mycobacterium antarcticum]|nr:MULTISPECIES: hypothetical protein [unclassified Mycolicibacterium]BDX33571.1 hypothetical protein TUM20985_41180 [Mycolicibacterium sp. TUM20985]GLP76746.1 hypothetical protein TUM20983_38560 [Mycolicibacterium sp. TUM20983]GLP82817.1 hypothetical protein TUM20984_42370 [Mycolicibacterium sp. TUM20984]